MLQQALQKIQTEIAANTKNKYVQVVGGFLIDYIRSNPQDADKVMAGEKTVSGSLDAMKTEAQKNKTGNVGVLTDEEGFAVVLKYFGVHVPEATPAPAAGFDISLDDLL